MPESRSGDQEIAAFSAVLSRSLGRDDWPPTVAGDLSDLLGTLDKGARSLRRLMEAMNKREAASALLGIEILIEDELARFAVDLLPHLKSLSDELYSSIDKS